MYQTVWQDICGHFDAQKVLLLDEKCSRLIVHRSVVLNSAPTEVGGILSPHLARRRSVGDKTPHSTHDHPLYCKNAVQKFLLALSLPTERHRSCRGTPAGPPQPAESTERIACYWRGYRSAVSSTNVITTCFSLTNHSDVRICCHCCFATPW